MFNKKILMSIVTISVLVTVASSGTWAYYSSSITVTGNTITTGTVSLSLENDDKSPDDVDDVSFVANNAIPGDTDIHVKSLKIINTGNVPGKLTVTAANPRDSKVLGKYLTLKVGDQVIYDHGHPVEAVLRDNLNNRYYVKSDVTYSFDEIGSSQNEVQNDVFTCDIVFTLRSV